MPRKGENIRKRKDGRWEGRYRNGFTAEGTYRYSSVYGKSYLEVKNKLLFIRHETACFQSNPFVEKRLCEVLALWLATNQIKIKRSTAAKYSYMIDRHINPQLGTKKISSLSAPHINSFLFEKMQHGRLDGKGGLSASYVKTIAIIISSALEFAATEGFCQPFRGEIIKPTTRQKDIQILSVSAQQLLEQNALENIDETRTGIYIALYTGIRIGELCALAWEDVDLEAQVIHIRNTISRIRVDVARSSATRLIIDTPKTRAAVRDIPISEALLPVLEHMKSRSMSSYVISNQPDFLSTRTFDYRYKKVLNDIGIPKINFHSLRHTFATRCIEVGMDVKSLSRILGHSSVAITMNTYVHPSMDVIRVQLQKLNSLCV